MSILGNLVHKIPYGPRQIIERARLTALIMAALRGVYPRTCSICGYEGKFRAFGAPPSFTAFDAQCRKCDSLSRHRLFQLMDDTRGILTGIDLLLHFAPEEIFRLGFKKRFKDYKTADLFRDDVDYQVNIEDTKLPSDSFDAAFVSHVLEHVDDRKAIAELARILKPGGLLIAMVPVIDGWDSTYENDAITSERGRELHFGQEDHIRYYGRDFIERLKDGFDVTYCMASPEECVRYGLDRGERIFLARKPVAAARVADRPAAVPATAF